MQELIARLMEQSAGRQKKVIEIWFDDGKIRVDSELNSTLTIGILDFASYVVSERAREARESKAGNGGANG